MQAECFYESELFARYSFRLLTQTHLNIKQIKYYDPQNLDEMFR